MSRVSSSLPQIAPDIPMLRKQGFYGALDKGEEEKEQENESEGVFFPAHRLLMNLFPQTLFASALLDIRTSRLCRVACFLA